MAETEASLPEEQPRGWLGRLRAWSSGSKRRNQLIGVGLGLATIATIALWLTMAEIAVAPDAATVSRALEALDAGENELAKSIIRDLQEDDDLSASDFGGGLYVLGALKVREAQKQWSPDRARTDYYIASKYLNEARSIGFPEGRQDDGLYLLGKSLIESQQVTLGIDMLQRAIAAGAKGEARAHLLLAEAFFFAPKPEYDRTIKEVDQALTDQAVATDQRAAALLLRAEALSALGRGVEAQQSVEAAGAMADPSRRELVQGKALIAQLENPQTVSKGSLAEQASAALERARQADNLSTSITRESDYLAARIEELVGKRSQALAAYDQLRRSQGTSPAGIAATLASADLYQQEGDSEAVLKAYRHVLDTIDDPNNYRSPLVPLSEVKSRVRAAHDRLLEEGQYAGAIELSQRVGRLLGRTTQLEMRANALSQWGDSNLSAAEHDGAERDELIRRGRRYLREAGVAYESLAEARFATRQFTDDLWTAAETLQAGQAFGEAIRVLNRYLRNEPVQRNALGLLKLGEAHLAQADDELAIAAFEECLEFHANDASSFAARLQCAKAYRGRGDLERAETLLRHNLSRTALTPDSPEWRDSKFELGRLLAEMNRHEEAIVELEDAIERYVDVARTRDDLETQHEIRTAKYDVALAHRSAAEEPLARLQTAKTLNEQETARAEAHEHLLAALAMFQAVQKEITLESHNNTLDRATLRNCYMLGGDVLFELGRYEEARQAFSSISTLYQNEPYMLEALVQIYHCWRRQQDRVKARGVIQQARLLLDRLPEDADFASSTTRDRNDWKRLLDQLYQF